MNSIEIAFDPLWNDGLTTICNTIISPCGFNGKIFHNIGVPICFPSWENILNNVFSIRHKIIHDANFHLENNFELVQKAEALFLLIPQITTFNLAQRYNLKSTYLKVNNEDFPYIFSIHDILAKDWIIKETI